MINGEGNGEVSPLLTASPDPSFPHYTPLPDADVAGEGESLSSLSSPRYSTCGDSEFDRYSSANSVMGTPSFSTSLGNHDPSLSQLGGSFPNFDNFCLGGRGGFDPYFATIGSDDGGVKLNSATSSSVNDKGSKLGVDDTVDGGGTSVPMSFDAVGADGLSDDGQVSSRYGYDHSDGEDSMFGCGTDDDKRADFYHDKCIQLPKENNENVLLMNSSIAFGSDDWDDYVQGTRANSLVSVGLDDSFWGHKQPTVGYSADNLVNGNEGRDGDALTEASIHHSNADLCKEENVINMKYKDANIDKVKGINKSAELPNMCSGENMYVIEQDFLIETPSLNEVLSIKNDGLELEHPCTSNQEASSGRGGHVPKSLEKTILDLEPLSECTVGHPYSAPRETTEDNTSVEDCKSCPLQSPEEKIAMKDSPASNQPAPIKAKSHQLNDFEDDIVHEMEEILLNSSESPGARFVGSSRAYQSQSPLPSRDSSSTASTSRADTEHLMIYRRLKMDRVEVIGARQKKGDVSLSERLVGVKEYTVYKIRVWSGEDKWEVERRYRDFFTLYRQLKTLYVNQGWILPSPWAYVERESRKIFGNASPTVVSERSVLIQDCLCSLVDSRLSSNHLSPLIWFLSPPTADPRSPASVTDMPKSPFSATEYVENISIFGRTISLVVENWPYKSTKQILEAQHYTCSGCHKHFDDGKTRIWEIVKTLGWGKPRLCEYSGQLFCASCHTNDTAVLPAKVLHLWDFSLYPVSQMAKQYLDSINDQPMLCVSAVNPLLFTKVPALLHVTDVRKKIQAMLPYVHCPFRRTIFKGLGSRRYLLESNDFFALRDLIDLSKGVFAALPVMVETLSRKISEHITEQCLICCDMGVPCNARQDCDDPSSIIFPFQEEEVKRCRSCGLVFHKPCFKKTATCPCGVNFMVDKTKERLTNRASRIGSNERGSVETQADSTSSVSFLSGLFTKGRREKLLERKADDNVILMGFLPSTSL